MSRALRKLWNDESGTAAIEYPLLMALIAVGLIGALTQLGGSLDQLNSTVAANISPVAEVAPPPAASEPAPPPPDPPPDEDDD
jgi:pilus assembly protein Flp/PilA